MSERIKADDPNLAVNVIAKAVELSSIHEPRVLAVQVIRALHDAGYKIVNK